MAPEPDALAFTAPGGGPLRNSNFRRRVWLPAVSQAGLPEGLRIHDLRHTAASFMIFEGAHLELVRCQLGHSSIRVTESYAHLYPAQGQELADRLDARYRSAHEQDVGVLLGSEDNRVVELQPR